MKKSNLMPSIVLSAICLVAALLLSVINMFTLPRIEHNKKQKEIKSLQEVLPEGTYFDPIDITDAYPDVITGGYKSDAGFVFKAEVTGYKSGLIIMVGIDNDGRIAGVKHTSSNETYGAESELNQKYTDRKDNEDSLEMILSAGASAPLTSGAYYTALDAALEAAKIASGHKTVDESCNEALGTAGKTFSAWFATEVLDGIDNVYTADDNSGYVFVIGESFVGVNANGEIVTAGVSAEDTAKINAAYTAIKGSTLTEVSKPAGATDALISVHKTASGNYVLVTTGDGYGGPIEVKISISSDGKILSTKTVSHSETPTPGGAALENPDFSEAFNGTTSESYEDVANVSGATLTSNGYKAAIGYAFEIFEILTSEGGNE